MLVATAPTSHACRSSLLRQPIRRRHRTGRVGATCRQCHFAGSFGGTGKGENGHFEGRRRLPNPSRWPVKNLKAFWVRFLLFVQTCARQGVGKGAVHKGSEPATVFSPVFLSRTDRSVHLDPNASMLTNRFTATLPCPLKGGRV